MKYFISLVVISAIYSFGLTGNIYNLPIKDIDGNAIDLSAYQNKKMLFVTLPLSATDTSIKTSELSALATQHSDSLIILGIPAEETGYTIANKEMIKSLYSNLPSNFILTEGMKVKKTSGEQQAPLFQWLTDKNQNKYYDTDVQGTGQKFFVDERGRLYGVFGIQVRLSYSIVNKVLSKPLNQ